MIITNLLTNMVVLNAMYVIPTNTPAFQDYAWHTMATNAQALTAKWHLKMEKTNVVVSLPLEATPWGIRGGVMVGGRYYFGADSGRFVGFSDEPFNRRIFDYATLRTNSAATNVAWDQQLEIYSRLGKTNDAIAAQWLHAGRLLTRNDAERIAAKALEAEAVLVGKNGFKRTTRQQEDYETVDGDVLQLPYYTFKWETTNEQFKVEVSGVTSNVVALQMSSFFGKLERPANYYEMLGLPSNVVFVKRRYGPGPTPTYEIIEPQPSRPGTD